MVPSGLKGLKYLSPVVMPLTKWDCCWSLSAWGGLSVGVPGLCHLEFAFLSVEPAGE